MFSCGGVLDTLRYRSYAVEDVGVGGLPITEPGAGFVPYRRDCRIGLSVGVGRCPAILNCPMPHFVSQMAGGLTGGKKSPNGHLVLDINCSLQVWTPLLHQKVITRSSLSICFQWIPRPSWTSGQRWAMPKSCLSRPSRRPQAQLSAPLCCPCASHSPPIS